MLPREIVIFCLTNKRGFRNHANRYLRMYENTWNELQTNLTLDNDGQDEWNTVLHSTSEYEKSTIVRNFIKKRHQ